MLDGRIDSGKVLSMMGDFGLSASRDVFQNEPEPRWQTRLQAAR